MNKIKGRDRKQHLDIISMVEECDNAIQDLDKEKDDYSENRRIIFETCLHKVKKKTIKEATLYALIAYAFKTGGSMCDRLLTVLYDLQPIDFLKCFKKTQKVPRKIVESA